jgi:hypothetical protein
MFPTNYVACREAFRKAAERAGALLTRLALEALGPRGEDLSIDVAWIGDEKPRRVLVHLAGVHGVEGFAGAAIQRRIIERPPPIPQDAALVLVHAVNPYGMAWLRRVNENNVDLNRNFLGPDEQYRGSPAVYGRIDRFLNPPGPPRPDGFFARAAWNVLRFGFGELKQAIARGQYDYPRGLFYGGNELQPGPRRLCQWLDERLRSVECGAAIDVHTGLGRSGADMLLVPDSVDSDRFALLRRILGPDVTPMHEVTSSYRITGGIHEGILRLFPSSQPYWVTQEFGTYHPFFVLGSLRSENRWHHFGQPAQLDHPSKLQLLRAFCPPEPDWQQKIVARGAQLVRQLSEAVFGAAIAAE